MRVILIIFVILFIIGYATNSVTLTKKEKEELEYGGEIIRTFETNSVKNLLI